MTIEHEQLHVTAGAAETLSVDKEAKVIKGFVVAQAGPFKTLGRGEFDEHSLRSIVRLMKRESNGLPSYYGHAKPGESPHQLGKLLGRARNPRIEDVPVIRDGAKTTTKAVLADLHLSATAFENNPNGNIGEYVMGLASEDPGAFGSSLVLEASKEYRTHYGKPERDDKGNALAPLWRPLLLASIDVVGQGEAVDSFLPSKLSTDEASIAEAMADDPDNESEASINIAIATIKKFS